TWTEGSTYTVNEAVTLQVKATLNGVDSAVAMFTYSVICPISTALAGAANATFSVQGVVTMVDGRNIYVQDATGGICLFFNTAPSDIALGDTVIFTGNRTTYKGLPELTGQSYAKSSGLTLTAKDATIGALTDADLCTYLHIADLTVTAIDGSNVTVQDANGDSLPIYKPVLGSTTLAVGNVIDFHGALGIFNTRQLRNTLASEIVVTDTGVQTPTADVASGAVAAGTVVTFSCATEGAVISYSTDGGETWTEGSTYTVNEAVTLTVKATLDGVDSATATFTYTIQSEQPAGNTFGLTSTLATGDEIIILNAASNMAVTSTPLESNTNYLTGANLVPASGVITTDDTTAVWTVTVNSDGTYTFTQGDKTLGGTQRTASNGKIYNNFVLTNPAASAWTLESTSTANQHYLYLGDLPSSKTNGHIYLEWYATYSEFSLFDYANPGTNSAFIFSFYKRGAEPEIPDPGETGDLVTSLDQLTDGTTVAIYSPGHKTAISTKPNGDWYLKANQATIENGKVVNFTEDFVWTVKKNADGTYSFYANGDESRSITVWKSDTYAELSLNVATYPDNTWTLTPAQTANCYYFSSPTVSSDRGPAYIEAYVRNEFEVFSGYFTTTSSNKFTENEFALQFYLVNPEDAVAAYDDGEWDGVLQKGGQYVAYNATAASSIGLFAEANYSMRAIPTTIEGGKANAGNGAYVFTVDTMGRYYTFKVGDKFFATNASEELLFVEPNEDGSAPENAKWFLQAKDGGYIIYNKDATYNGTPVCVEYYSSVFSGWTFSTKNDVGIYLFNFYEVVDGTEIRDGVVQAPSVIFDCEDSRYVEQDYVCSFSLDDLAESISSIAITYTAGSRTNTVALEDCTVSSDGKTYSFTIPAADIDAGEVLPSFTIRVNVTNSYDITYSGEKTVTVIDEPFFTDLTPAPNSQTRDDKRPVISARVGNVGENPTFTMTVNGQAVNAVFANGVLSYTPAEDMADGRVTVAVSVVRADGVNAEKTWNFTVGIAEYQLYFGQLHSHTTYSDGSGTLDTALEYIASLPESANVQFVAFTDHSNYFDTTSAANPADALNDKSLMTDASRALWEEYKNKAAAFNASHENLLAIAGFEMTWSGGPGHINTFDSDGLVSRNNAALNNKSGDAGMKLYYETVNKGNSINQFNHPGNTFGNFTDFSYWDEATDAHMFLVEVGNGEGQIGAGGYYPSYEQYIMALDKGWHVAPTNNQDNHKGRWGNANDARDVILTNEFSEQGIYDAIRALRVYATEDKNLQISYTVNDEPMGTIFTDENTPEKLNVMVSLFDPDTADSVSKVEVVVNGGVTAYTWDNATDLAAGQLTAELDPEYSYYFIRVTQKDGDLAVTAPVWVGNAVKLGITDIKANAEEVYKDEAATLVTTLYNNEATAATVKSLIYTVNGGEVIGTDTNTYTIPAGGTLGVDFAHTFDTAKLTTVTVTAIVELDGKEYTFTANVELDVLDRQTEGQVTPIADVRAASDPADTGYRFTIEGVVTSNASGYDKDTAFFDCIYVQDETGGICCFPVSGEYKIGDKVRIVGHTDFYQGEPELQVKTIEVIGTGTVEPTEIKASQLNDRSAEGKLVTIKGTVDSFEAANGLIQTIMVKDAEGNLARVFIDGYITTDHEVENCVVGAQISATGLASYDDTFNAPEGPFQRIRIRDRADVVCTAPAEGYHIIVTDKTNGAATTDIVADQTYSGDVTFTVNCAKACVVAIVNGDGTYTKLVCTTGNGEHKFTVTVTDADVEIVVAMKGDVNLDGKVGTMDATMAKQKYLGTAFAIDANLQMLTADVSGDGKVTTVDATMIKQAYLGSVTIQW
ncbi:MAG: CehA/McbA family metallohydrolase, partial [Oscillospiraceae bacterium]|nr:CehA/McbA family metallohydrolase [Oscillospiraceae bacterium]